MKSFDYEANKHLLVDSNGRRLTAGMFEELADPAAAAKPVFKLSDWRRIYVELSDPTEYHAAMALIGNWEHWEMLQTSVPFKAELDKWRHEVEVKVRCEAIAELVKQSRSPKGTMAAKWLAEAGFVKRDKRSTKERQEAESTKEEVNKRIGHDAKRLGLVKGGKE